MKGVKGLNLFKKNFRFQEKISSLLYSLVSGENKSRFDLSRSVMAESQNRQILQDLQQKRQMLLNQGQGSVMGSNLPSNRSIGPETSTAPIVKLHDTPVIRNPADMSLSQRQALEHANATSSGYFISQDSAHGNLILPVLPRFESDQ